MHISSSMELNPASLTICSSTSDSGTLNNLNDPDLDRSTDNMLPKHQMGFFNIQDLHLLATANLIAQTQETIAQQFNITVDTHLEKQKKTKSQSPEKVLERGSRTSQGKVKRPASRSKSEDSATAKRICVNRDAGKEGKTAEAKGIKTVAICDVSALESPATCIEGPTEVTDIQAPAKHFCTECNENCNSAAKLKTHMRTHKPLECQHPGCNKKFTWPSHFKYHQLTHAGEKKFKCDSVDCSQEFYTAQQLEVHHRTHDNNRPFTCHYEYCARSFTTAGNLKNHMRCHTGEKPFACDYPQCDKRFAELSTLKKHKITHTGQKPYICELCGKSFTQSSSRRVHMKSHSAAAMINCKFCCQTFTQSSALREHVVSVHPQEESNIFREHLTVNQDTECVVKNGSSGGANGSDSLHYDNIGLNGTTESRVPVEKANNSKEKTVLSEEELAAHIKTAVSSPNDNICILVLPSGQDNSFKSIKYRDSDDW